MSRASSVWILIALVCLAAGCTMCASTFDECGPTATGGCGRQCGSTVRARPFPLGGTRVLEEGTVTEEPVVSEVPGQVPGGFRSTTGETTDSEMEHPNQPLSPPGGTPPAAGDGWRSRSAAKTPSRPAPILQRP